MGFINTRRCFNFSFFTLLKARRVCSENVFSLNFGTKIMDSLKTAYFQHCKEEGRVEVLIYFNENNKERIFKFDRKVCETIEIFLQRLDHRVQNLIYKKLNSQKKKKNEPVEPISIPQKLPQLFLNDQQLPNEVKFQDIFEDTLNQKLKLRILDADYNIHLNFPIVKNIILPKVTFVGCIVCPETFKAQFVDKTKSVYTWYKSLTLTKPIWEKCGEGYHYVVKKEDVNSFLKFNCIPKLDEKVGPEFSTICTTPVGEFQSLEEIKRRHEFTKEKTKPNEIRVVTYNVLAETYTQTKEAKTLLFTFCDPCYLDFNYRKNLLIIELFGYNADIICLQEVDTKVSQYYSEFLNFLGYSYVFHEKEGAKEGCLFIYNQDKFSIFSANQYIFSKEVLSNPLFDDIKVKLQDNDKLMQRLENVSSQIQVVVLEKLSEDSKDLLVIGNTHFYFHPDADHIRLLQGVLSWKILLNTVEKLKKKQPSKTISLILCGDLNSTPECGFHQLLNTGFIGSDHVDWKSKEDEAVKDINYHHSVKMKSAYDNTQFTNFTPLFKGCIDYIYYQIDHLELIQNVPVPSEEVLSSFSGIPSKCFPSDHVALIADLKFKD